MNAKNLLPNLLSGFTVFLIALPLSVGIALASGAPPSAGLLAAIVGGILGAAFDSSKLAINGPAAGLIVIVLGAIADLGNGDAALGFRRTLAAIVIAGLLQVLFGGLKLGKYSTSIPTSVLHGMMAAIGISIVAKQIHVAFGVVPMHKDIIGLLLEIPQSFTNFNPEVLIVALFSAVVTLAMLQVPEKISRYMPSPLIVVIMGMGLASFLDFEHEHMVAAHMATMNAGPKFLLNIPDHFASLFVIPDFSVWNTLPFFHWVFTIAMVASVESLLSAVALDRIDPERRTTDLNRELISKGLCNALLGSIGGLPIIAEIVRSNANIRNGAKDKTSNFFHGALILLFVAAAPLLLHKIPLSALAVILIFVGIRLANPSQVLHLAEIGKGHALAFVVTLAVTLASDLLDGVFAGILVEFAYAWFFGKSLKSLFRVQFQEEEQEGDRVALRVTGPVAFSNWVRLYDQIDRLGSSKKVILDLSDARLVDHSTMEHLERLRVQGYSTDQLEIVFHPEHQAIAGHPLSGKVRRDITL